VKCGPGSMPTDDDKQAYYAYVKDAHVN